MSRQLGRTALVGLIYLVVQCDAQGRGFGGFHAGAAGGYRAGSFGGYSAGAYGGFHEAGAGAYSGPRGGSYSGYRSGGAAVGPRGGYAGGTYDRTWDGSHGGSVTAEGARGAAVTPWGAAAGRTRDVTATGPGGRTYTDDRRGGVAAGPGGVVAGGSRAGVATGPGGTVAAGSRWGAGATRFPTDAGLAHYSSVAAGGVAHSTAYWSHGTTAARAGYVRSGFFHYDSFTPAWYTAHRGAWVAGGWPAGAAWAVPAWPTVSTWCNVSAPPAYYDYGNTIVYQGDTVYVDGASAGAPAKYAGQAIALADQGVKAKPPEKDSWQALGVFALVQGDEKSSNQLFQLAVNKEGVLRGNFYDALLDSAEPVYGTVDKKTQRAAWTIGKKSTRVFETGLYNLTRAETPVLVHFGKDRTQQWLLVRLEKPKDKK